MKKILILILSFSFIVGCATQRAFKTNIKQGKSEAYSQLLSKVAMLNYNVVNANEGAGFIRAEKQTTGGGFKFMTGKDLFDQLSISVVNNPSTNKVFVRVNAASVEQTTTIYGGGSRTFTKASDEVVKDAIKLLEGFGGKVFEMKN